MDGDGVFRLSTGATRTVRTPRPKQHQHLKYRPTRSGPSRYVCLLWMVQIRLCTYVNRLGCGHSALLAGKVNYVYVYAGQ